VTGPQRIPVCSGTLEPHTVDSVIRHLKRGGLLAYPTETVYGFGCVPDPAPLARLERLKPRRAGGAFLLLVPSARWVSELRWPEAASRLADAFWPGPLTLVLGDPYGRYPPPVRATTGTVAVRVSPHPVVDSIVRALGRPLTSTSANMPGAAPATTGEAALEAAVAGGAGDDLWVLDVGELPPAHPSTLVDVSGAEPRILRTGAVSVRRIREVLPEIHEPTS
jgi:L-threonylcarbamoyladenylate synthase